MDSTVDHDEIGPSEDVSHSSRSSSKDGDDVSEEEEEDHDESASASMLAETIAQAAASAVAYAAFNQRSDSILSPECSEYDDDDDDGSSRNLADFESQSLVPGMSEDAYMESESIEATVTTSDQRTKLMSRGKSITAADIRSSVLSDGSFGESAREWERSPFSTVPESVPAADDDPDPIVEGPSAVETIPDAVEEILQACGALTLSVECLGTLWEQSEVAIIRTLYLSRSGSDFQMPDQFSNMIRISSTVPDDNAFLLHSVFATFCTPCPSMESVEKILDMERSSPLGHEAVALPMDALISMPSPHKEAVVKILRNHRHLFHLPPPFQRAFFRILIRLLTNRTDAEYDRDCTLNMKWDRDDDVESRDSSVITGSASRQESHVPGVLESDAKLNGLQKATHDRIQKVRESREAIDRRRKEQLWCVERMPQPSGKHLTSKRLDQVYAFVRFRAGAAWEGKTAVSVLLDLLDAAQENHQYLLPPVVTLIGLASTAGVAVCEVLRMLQIAAQPVKSVDFLDRVLMAKALTAAAEGDSQSSLLVGKASPKHFFTFGKSSNGVSRTITSLPHWPFRNDFGVAIWFRCETFDRNVNPTLVSIASPQGAGIDVSLMPLESDQTAAVIVVTVRDADSEEVERVIVNNCVLLPRVWYHLGVRHTRSRLKGVFSLSARQQLSVLLDGKLILTESLRFPNVTAPENVLSPPKSFLSGLQIGKINTTSLTVQFGAQFEGQTGALYLFSDCVSDATLKALCHVTAGTRQRVVKKSLLSDDNWDSKNQPGKAVVELNSVDADEVVMAQEKIPRLQRWTSSVIDLSDADDSENDVLPELSRTALHSKLFLVWDPKRVDGSLAIDLHSGAHATMDSNVVQASCFDGIKDVIASIGGVQTLLPIANALLSGEIERHWKQPNQEADRSTDFSFHASTTIVPSLLSMMAAFLRSHDKNAREMMRCGGVDILEQRLLQNKELGVSGQSLVSVLRTTPSLTNMLVDSLLELRLACEHYAALENTVFSRLLFNMPLWFGGASLPVGVSLYPTLLPVLSSLTNVTPHKVRNTVGVRPLVELLHLYTDVGDTKAEHSALTLEPATELFDRSEASGLRQETTLTIQERRHAIDVILGMIATILQVGTTPAQLSALVNYISFNADYEWEEASRQSQAGVDPNIRVGTRYERHQATLKASTILSVLLKARPINLDLISSLGSCCGGPQALLGWILSTLVNTFDDEMRSVGIRCLADVMDSITSKADMLLYVVQDDNKDEAGRGSGNAMGKTTRKVSATFTSVGKSLSTAIGGQVLSTVMHPVKHVSLEIVYKLLWHLLKRYRARMGRRTHIALNYMLVEDIGPRDTTESLMKQLVIPDKVLHIGYRLSLQHDHDLFFEMESVAGKRLRKNVGINMVLRLLRFLPSTWKDKWLVELVTLTYTGTSNIQVLVEDPDWQPSLFHVISDCLEEINAKYDARAAPPEMMGPNVIVDSAHSGSDILEGCLILKEVRNEALPGEGDPSISTPDNHSHLQTRFNLSLKLYCTLLGYCFRLGGEKGINAVEQAASLERVCVNGHDVFCMVLNHLLADLIEKGTVSTIDTGGVHGRDSNWLLKESARMVTEAILAKGSNSSIDASFALKQWHGLRHLAVIASCVVAKSGFGLGDIFDYRNQPGASVDPVSGGLYGIRLPDTNSTALNAAEYIKSVRNGAVVYGGLSAQDRYRRISVCLSAQTLSLLDAFIFPDSLDASLPISQLHGLALVRSNEARLGVSQGPILASLVRLSLVLLCNLEPSSIKCLQCCSRLRCFMHWSLELIRESVALAGYSAAFHDLTAPLDRLLLAVVLHCHRALARCSAVLSEIESSPLSKYFHDEEARKKYDRRLLRVSFELREIVVTAYRGRNEVLRAALSFQAFEALQESLESNKDQQQETGKRPLSQETVVREFLHSQWVRSYHDIDRKGDLCIPDQVANGQPYQNKRASNRGFLAVKELSSESSQNVIDFNRALDGPFKIYLDDQKNWAETDLVRDLEYDGDAAVKRFSLHHRNAITETARNSIDRTNGAANRWEVIERQVTEPWTSREAHWKFGEHPDCLGRHILMVRNRNFNDHEDASYELMLGLERERAEREREERQRKNAEREQENLVDVVKRNAAYVPYKAGAILEDEEDIGMDESTSHPTVIKDGPDLVDAVVALAVEESKLLQPLSAKDVEVEEYSVDKAAVDEDFWAKSFVWTDMESVVARFDDIELVTVRTTSVGKLLLTSHGLYFHQTGDTINVMTKEIDHDSEKEKPLVNRSLRWRLSRLREAHGRRFMLRAQAIELFFADGTELFVNFRIGARERDRFYAKLRNSCKVPLLWSPKSLNPRVVFKKSKVSQLWRRGKISNFEYLMHLNKIAGRTFNDVTQYPVFPWVLADYTSETIDLNDSRVYRDLSKPVGALNEERLACLIERYNELESFGFAENERFLYGSHYSSPGVVLHYLIRHEPFSSMAIELQSGRFDCPDRLFFDIAGCWVSCMTSTSDVKELVPELFTCPEVLMNTNKFPLGRTQDNRNISDVALPPWAKGSAHEFIRVHRLALESEYVSQNLNLWIDLIFGFKQRGPSAEAAHNVFHYLSYEGAIDMSKITDELERKATESQIQNFGQTPSQLITRDPHPSRYTADDRWKPLIYNGVLRRLFCHTPSKQFSPRQSKGAVASIRVLTDTIVAIYEDMSVGIYKFAPSPRDSKRPFFFKADKHRLLAKLGLSVSRATIKRASADQTSTDVGDTLSVGSWSFAVTLGGATAEGIRRKVHTSARLTSSNDITKEAEASAYLLSCGYWDDTVKMHSLDGLKFLCSDFGGHQGPIRCLTMGTDGALMVTGGQDATCRVWVVDHSDMALALCDGYTQTTLGVSNDSGNLLKLCHILWGHAYPISCLDMSSELDVVVSGDLGGLVCVHTIRRGEFIRSIIPKSKIPGCAVRKIALEGNGTFAVHMADQSLHVYTINDVHLSSSNAEEDLHDMKICSGGEILVSGGDKGQLVIRLMKDLAIQSILDVSKHGPIRCISLTPDDLNPIPQYMFIGSQDGLITVVSEDPNAKVEDELVVFGS